MDRRTFVCAGAGVVVTAVAGCSGDGNGTTPPDDTQTDTTTQAEDTRSVTEASGDEPETTSPTGQRSQPPEDVVSGGVVDYSAFTDGDGSIDDSASTIEYSSPDLGFRVETFVDGTGEVPDDTEFRVSPDLSSADPTIFFAPVAREESGWDFHVFANTAFVDRHDWNVIRTTEAGVGGGIDVGFSEVTDSVHHFSASGSIDGSRGVAVSTQSATDLLENGVTGTLFNVIFSETPEEAESDESTASPSASFSFDHDQDEQTLTIAHQGGDNIPVSDLVVRVEGDVIDSAFDDVEGDTVTAGTTTTIEVGEHADSSGETTVRVVWMDDDLSAVLAESTL